MVSVMNKRSLRWAIYGLLVMAVLVLNGCQQREVNNPFVGPFGASSNSPFGG